MALIPWKNKQRGTCEPESSRLLTLRDEMDRLFDAFVREPMGSLEWPSWRGGEFAPAIDIGETETEVVVHAELPGLAPEDLDVTLAGNQLTLAGEKKEVSEQRAEGSYQTEIRFGKFRRTVQLPQEVDPEQVESAYSDGVLTLRLKKASPTPPKRIEVTPRTVENPPPPAPGPEC